MANRCLLPGEESASHFFSCLSVSFPAPARFSGALLPALLGKVDEKARPVDENSSARHTAYAELRCISRTFGGRRYSTLIPLGRGYPCLIPLLPLPASRRFPLAAGFTPASSLLHHLLLRRRYSFKRLVFPVGTWQPQQRHEKRLINKLIRFRPTPRCTPFVLNLFFSLRKRLSRCCSSRCDRTYGSRPLSASGNATPRIRIQLTFH